MWICVEPDQFIQDFQEVLRRPGDPVRILFDDLIAELAGHLLEIAELGFRMLVDGRNPRGEGGQLHGRRRLAFGACFVTYCSINFNSTSWEYRPRPCPSLPVLPRAKVRRTG